MNLQAKPLNILFVENSDEDIELILAELRRGGYKPVIEQIITDEEMRTALQKSSWDLILSDHSLPQFDSLSALQLYKESGLEIPFIIISGTMREDVAAQAMKAGAHDYLSKDNLARLVPIIQRELHQVELRLKLKRAKEAIKQQSEQTIAFHAALLRLASQAKPNLEVALKEILKADADAIAVERVSYWSLQTNPDAITCEALFLKTSGNWERGIQLRQQDYPKYFECMEKNPVIVASDAQRDPRTEEFTESYLRPLNISSMLDVPVWLEGKLVGVICHEHVGPRRDWTEEEEKFAISIGHMIALALGEHRNKQIEAKRLVFASLMQKLNLATNEKAASRIIVDAADELLGWDACSFDLYSAEPPRLHPILNLDTIEGKRREVLVEFGNFPPNAFKTRVLNEGGKLILRDDNSAPDGEFRPFGDTNRRSASLLFAPIRHGAKLMGIISIQSYERNAYGQEDVGVLQSLADHCGGVLERLGLETQLRQAQKMESVGQLAGGVAHDFNNILTIIQGHSSIMLSSETLKETERESAQQISLAAERAANLIRQLLTFSRRQVIQARALDLNEIVNNISKMLRRLLGEDVCLQVNYSPIVPVIFADQGMIEQVLMNLAVNSRDAMPKGGNLVISTSMQQIDQSYAQQSPDAFSGEAVCLTVTDTGCGIPAENLSHIYDPFFTTKAVGLGTGLGLASVYGIVKQHSGWIKVQSEVGKGTSFKIYFPSKKDKKIKRDISTEKFSLRGGTETILLVEDESPVRNLVQQILKKLGYAVLEADSAVTALKVWKENRETIDLVLTDMIMPDGMTGQDLAEIVQFDRPDIKVIFTSGYNVEIVGKDFNLNEGLNFIQKPYQPKKLAKAVRDCLDNSLAAA